MFENKNYELWNGDCLELIKDIPNESIDIIITSPPYNVNLGNNKYNKKSYNSYNDNLQHGDYIKWLCNIFELCYKKLKNSGRVCINIGNGKNGQITTTTDLIIGMKNIGYKVLAQIIWNKNNTSNRCAWGSYMSPSCPSFPTPFEYILIFYKGDKKLKTKGITDITKEEFITYANSLWTFTGEKKSAYNHPAPFPVELPTRCIKMLTYKKSIVLDPFMGSGSTGIACLNTNRKFIGIEIDKNYFNIAKNRIENEIKNN